MKRVKIASVADEDAARSETPQPEVDVSQRETKKKARQEKRENKIL